MKFSPAKREQTPVAKPPPESLPRVDGGGPWGPTQFDLPERDGSNTQAVVVVAVVGVVVLLVIAGLWALLYFRYN
ncbi:hypothetical protein AB0P21_35560 [Kribbella sp. NPDC056861]|uniref:hypothetical protein n=1 Tax=Kribbella sp. NPDC056861 TaxID=3154857 RepID=UPI00342F3674